MFLKDQKNGTYVLNYLIAYTYHPRSWLGYTHTTENNAEQEGSVDDLSKHKLLTALDSNSILEITDYLIEHLNSSRTGEFSVSSQPSNWKINFLIYLAEQNGALNILLLYLNEKQSKAQSQNSHQHSSEEEILLQIYLTHPYLVKRLTAAPVEEIIDENTRSGILTTKVSQVSTMEFLVGSN
jgi:hypothetical protein